MELEAPENANKKLQEAMDTKIAEMKTGSQNPLMQFAVNEQISIKAVLQAIDKMLVVLVEEEKDDVIERDTSQTMS